MSKKIQELMKYLFGQENFPADYQIDKEQQEFIDNMINDGAMPVAASNKIYDLRVSQGLQKQLQEIETEIKMLEVEEEKEPIPKQKKQKHKKKSLTQKQTPAPKSTEELTKTQKVAYEKYKANVNKDWSIIRFWNLRQKKTFLKESEKAYSIPYEILSKYLTKKTSYQKEPLAKGEAEEPTQSFVTLSQGNFTETESDVDLQEDQETIDRVMGAVDKNSIAIKELQEKVDIVCETQQIQTKWQDGVTSKLKAIPGNFKSLSDQFDEIQNIVKTSFDINLLLYKQLKKQRSMSMSIAAVFMDHYEKEHLSINMASDKEVTDPFMKQIEDKLQAFGKLFDDNFKADFKVETHIERLKIIVEDDESMSSDELNQVENKNMMIFENTLKKD